MKMPFRLFTVLFLTVFVQSLNAQLRLPAIFGNDMVLQQKSNVAVWGWGNPGSKVMVTGSWSNDTLSTKVENDAHWKLNIPTPAAGGPYTLSVIGEKKIVLDNVMIGEVWICSGQSNMEWCADWKINNAEEEVKNANYPDIRFFHVSKAGSNTPQDDCHAQWVPCSPATMRSFSAVGYFFGRNLQQNLNVPIGLINVSWGGTPAEVWVKKELVENDSVMFSASEKLKKYDWWPKEPGIVYNAMIAPLVPFGIAGAIWYQGESNVDNHESYRKLFRTLIESWRTDFGMEFPFYYVQIAPYTYGANSKAAYIREIQSQSLDIPKTGMVVVSDLVDDVKDIHPRNKQDVSKRLANIALSENYGIAGLIYKFPSYKSITVEKGKIRIGLLNADNGLMVKGEKPATFEIAGEDRKFVPAEAKIDGNTIVVWAKDIKNPVAVRYSFSNDGIGNVFSREGLPLAPFRSDNW